MSHSWISAQRFLHTIDHDGKDDALFDERAVQEDQEAEDAVRNLVRDEVAASNAFERSFVMPKKKPKLNDADAVTGFSEKLNEELDAERKLRALFSWRKKRNKKISIAPCRLKCIALPTLVCICISNASYKFVCTRASVLAVLSAKRIFVEILAFLTFRELDLSSCPSQRERGRVRERECEREKRALGEKPPPPKKKSVRR